MSEIRFTVDLPSGPVEASITDPLSEHTEPDERGCLTCGQDAYFSGCTAPGCNSYGCPDCATGCDLDFLSVEEGGQCASALEGEDWDECVDADGDTWPEHDFGEVECRRCGAEPEDGG